MIAELPAAAVLCVARRGSSVAGRTSQAYAKEAPSGSNRRSTPYEAVSGIS